MTSVPQKYAADNGEPGALRVSRHDLGFYNEGYKARIDKVSRRMIDGQAVIVLEGPGLSSDLLINDKDHGKNPLLYEAITAWQKEKKIDGTEKHLPTSADMDGFHGMIVVDSNNMWEVATSLRSRQLISEQMEDFILHQDSLQAGLVHDVQQLAKQLPNRPFTETFATEPMGRIVCDTLSAYMDKHAADVAEVLRGRPVMPPDEARRAMVAAEVLTMILDRKSALETDRSRHKEGRSRPVLMGGELDTINLFMSQMGKVIPTTGKAKQRARPDSRRIHIVSGYRRDNSAHGVEATVERNTYMGYTDLHRGRHAIDTINHSYINGMPGIEIGGPGIASKDDVNGYIQMWAQSEDISPEFDSVQVKGKKHKFETRILLPGANMRDVLEMLQEGRLVSKHLVKFIREQEAVKDGLATALADFGSSLMKTQRYDALVAGPKKPMLQKTNQSLGHYLGESADEVAEMMLGIDKPSKHTKLAHHAAQSVSVLAQRRFRSDHDKSYHGSNMHEAFSAFQQEYTSAVGPRTRSAAGGPGPGMGM